MNQKVSAAGSTNSIFLTEPIATIGTGNYENPCKNDAESDKAHPADEIFLGDMFMWVVHSVMIMVIAVIMIMQMVMAGCVYG